MEINLKSYYIIILLILSITGAQNLYAQDFRATKIIRYNFDSVMRAEQARKKLAMLPKRDSIKLLINSLPADTAINLRFAGYYLDTLPDLFRFHSLKEINFSDNDIQKTNKADFKSPRLRTIDLAKNRISKIGFPVNDSVRYLYLSGNLLKKIPHSIKKLKNLEILGLANNQISRIPHFLKKMKHLKEIDLSGNKLSRLKRSYPIRLKHIQKVLMVGNHISTLPATIGRMKYVTSLNFSKNDLSSLPEQFGALKNLRHLLFYENKFRQIPACIFKLTKLKELDFYYNQIDSVPPQISNLVNLEQLYLSYNNIQALPESMGSLKHLKYIYVHNNKLTFLPSWVDELQSLQRIGFGHNELIRIPDFSKLHTLTDLDLQSNNIDRFPWKMLNSKTLKLLYIQNNPLILSSSDRDRLEKERNELQQKGVVINY
ncbi:MAG: leucine-rich repeat domain-containing protein [Bacteroidales bacterium]|nr:leucine-rich repeat domain-containing protein [Bacteroidales bacterium]